MALKLTIIGSEVRLPRERAHRVFGAEGGRIGRAVDNEWVLPDPERFLSAHHASIRCHRDSYFLEDTSTNGVFLNGAPDPVGKTGPVQLRAGDRFRIGSFHMAVEFVADDAATIESSAEVPFAKPPTNNVDSGLNASLRLDRLLSTGSQSGPVRAVDAFGQPVADAAAAVAASRPPDRARASDRQSSPPISDAAIAAFCRGACLDPTALPAESHARLLHVAGLLMRETLVGLKQLHSEQRRLRVESGMQASDSTRAELANLQVEDLLIKLLSGHQLRELDAVQWLRELYAAARNHDAALLTAVRQALADYLPQLERLLPPRNPENSRRFRSLTELRDGQLPPLLQEALAGKFREELQRQAANR